VYENYWVAYGGSAIDAANATLVHFGREITPIPIFVNDGDAQFTARYLSPPVWSLERVFQCFQ